MGDPAPQGSQDAPAGASAPEQPTGVEPADVPEDGPLPNVTREFLSMEVGERCVETDLRVPAEGLLAVCGEQGRASCFIAVGERGVRDAYGSVDPRTCARAVASFEIWAGTYGE